MIWLGKRHIDIWIWAQNVRIFVPCFNNPREHPVQRSYQRTKLTGWLSQEVSASFFPGTPVPAQWAHEWRSLGSRVEGCAWSQQHGLSIKTSLAAASVDCQHRDPRWALEENRWLHQALQAGDYSDSPRTGLTPLPVLFSLHQFSTLRTEQRFDRETHSGKTGTATRRWPQDQPTDPTTCSDAADLIEPLEGTCEQQFEHETKGVVC